MTTDTLRPISFQSAWRSMPRPVLLALVLGVLLLGLLFHVEVQAAVQVWYDSTAYSHCFFVLPIAVYLAWERRERLAGVPIRPAPMVVLAAIPLGLAWLAANRLGIMEGRQLIAIAMVELLFLAVLGWQMAYALMAPLLYLFFLVPFGAFLTPLLQDITAGFIDVGLRVLQIPHYSNAYFIDIPEGRFLVAEACAGLRFLIASVAFGVLYAVLMYRTLGRQLGFMLASIIVPIVANGIRALGIVVLGHVLGSAEAAAADHILYGWVFFSIVILLLILAGLPFRQDAPAGAVAPRSVRPAGPAPEVRTLFAPVVGLVALAAVAIGFSGWLDRAAGAPAVLPIARFAIPAGCTSPVTASSRPGVSRLQFACPIGTFEVTVQLFSPRVNPGRIQSTQMGLTDEQEIEDVTFSGLDVPGPAGRNWRVISSDKPPRVTATALWVDGAPAQGGLRGRIALARNSLLGASRAPVLIAVTATASQPRRAGENSVGLLASVDTFLRAQTTLPTLVDQLSLSGTRP